jgi:hypothetical protein
VAEEYEVPSFMRPLIAEIVEELVAGRYEALEQDGRAGRVTASELRSTLEDYPATLVPLPDEAFAIGGDAYPIDGRSPPEWAVDQDLWTREEGRSDLTLQLHVQCEKEKYRVEITDLHVL